MSDPTPPAPAQPPPQPRAISWMDLTVPNAAPLRDFYSQVADWIPCEVEMDGYSDFAMMPRGGSAPVAGICHARGTNAGLPPVWLIYIPVTDLDASVARCRELGGRVVVEPRSMGDFGRYAVIQDPAGAFSALFQPADVG